MSCMSGHSHKPLDMQFALSGSSTGHHWAGALQALLQVHRHPLHPDKLAVGAVQCSDITGQHISSLDRCCRRFCRCNCPADAEEACSHYQQPLDFVYNWAAFNKLLLLGMYAPVEEAHAPQDQTQLVLQQLDDVAAARAVSGCGCGCAGMNRASVWLFSVGSWPSSNFQRFTSMGSPLACSTSGA